MSFVKSPKRTDTLPPEEAVSRDSSVPLLYFLLVSLGAANRSLNAIAANYWQVVHPERIVIVTCSAVALACFTLWALVRWGVRRHVALFAVLVGSVLIVGGGPMVRRIGLPLGWVAIFAVVILAVLIARLFSETIIQGAAVVLVVALISGALLSGYETWASMGSDNTIDSEALEVELVERPDIYVVVLDAYAGSHALEDVFDTTKDDLIGDLEGLGLQLPGSAWSPYASTEMAIPSVLDMSYPAIPAELTNAGRATLHRTIAGENRTLELVRANGYRTIMIESGWVGSSCGSWFDECLTSHWLDEVMFQLASDSLAYGLVLGRFGHAFTANSIHTVEAIEEVATRTDGGEPRLVFAHVLVPHPPFFLDEDCAIAVDDVRVNRSFGQDPADHIWDSLYLEQTRCVDRWLQELLGSVAPEDVVIFLGDHGIGRQPSPTEGERPPLDVIVEHQNVFLAVRTPGDCTLTDPIVTSDLMRQVFSCLGDEPLPPVDQRMFVWGGYEMTSAEVETLIRSFP